MLHEGVIYRHIVLTMPEMLRPTFYWRSQDLLSPLMRCGVKCLDDFYSRVGGRPLKGGYIVVIQTHGRSGQYNPHVHIIATSGGWISRLSNGCIWTIYPMRCCVKSGSGIC